MWKDHCAEGVFVCRLETGASGKVKLSKGEAAAAQKREQMAAAAEARMARLQLLSQQQQLWWRICCSLLACCSDLDLATAWKTSAAVPNGCSRPQDITLSCVLCR